MHKHLGRTPKQLVLDCIFGCATKGCIPKFLQRLFRNEPLALFAGLLGLLLVSVTAIFQKYIPLFLHHTVYFCQELMRSFSIQMPKSLGAMMLIVATIMGGLVLLKLIYTFIKIYLFKKKLLRKQITCEVTQTLEKKLNLTRKVSIIKDTKPLAFCFGIRRPKIYLSSGLLKITSEQELEAVLCHEKYHLEHKDSMTNLLASITISLFPFFPIVFDLVNHYQIKREMNADRAAANAMKSTSALVSVIRKFLKYDHTPTFAFAPALAEWDTLELRIKSLIAQKVVYPKLSNARIGVSLISAVTIYGLLLAPVNAIELHDQHQDAIMVCLQDNQCVSWCKENATVVPLMTKAQNAPT